MLIIPAVDIKGGQVVRLRQGDFSQVTVYGDSPAQAALNWQRQGARLLHVVDLDGARSGSLVNREEIEEIARSLDVPWEIGGGIREKDDIALLVELGARYVVLGTRAAEDAGFVRWAREKFGDRIAVSIDARGGKVATAGWQDVCGRGGIEFARELQGLGIKRIICTDISRDGMLAGVNVAGVKEMLDSCDLDIVVSGGVSCEEDIARLRALGNERLVGVIVGRALYEGKVELNFD